MRSLVTIGLMACAPAAAQEVPPEQPVAELVIDAAIVSRTARIGDRFPLHLAAPIVVDGATVIPAGTTGEGEVVHVAKAGGAGRAGELIVAARFLRCGGRAVRIGRLHLGATGRDPARSIGAAGAAAAGAAVLAPLAGIGAVVGLFVKGGEVTIPAGIAATARVTDAAPIAEIAAACRGVQ